MDLDNLINRITALANAPHNSSSLREHSIIRNELARLDLADLDSSANHRKKVQLSALRRKARLLVRRCTELEIACTAILNEKED